MDYPNKATMQYYPPQAPPQAGFYAPGGPVPSAPEDTPRPQYYPPPSGAAAFATRDPTAYAAGPALMYAAPPPPPPTGCCGGGAAAAPLADALAVAACAFHSAGTLALALGALFLLSSGWAVCSSILMIAQACLLRAAGATPLAMQELVAGAGASPPRGCCGAPRHANLRGLAIAAIVFAAMELALGLGLGLGLGISLGLPNDYSLANRSGSTLRICGATSVAAPSASACLVTVTSADMVYSSSSGSSGSTWTSPLAIVFRYNIGGSQYLLWAAGTTAFTAATNIALAVQTMKLSKMVVGLAQGMGGRGSE